MCVVEMSSHLGVNWISSYFLALFNISTFLKTTKVKINIKFRVSGDDGVDRKSFKGTYLLLMCEERIGGASGKSEERGGTLHWVTFMDPSPCLENLRKIIYIPARNVVKCIFVYHVIKYLVW